MITINCKKCNKEIKTFPSRIGVKKYCSQSCRALNNPAVNFIKGHKHNTGEKNWRWNGGYRKHKLGYINIYSPEHPNKTARNDVAEHRLVMEKYLKRFLLPNEVIHHINGIKNDNRIENLKVFSSQSEHVKEEYQTNKYFRNILIKNQYKKGCNP